MHGLAQSDITFTGGYSFGAMEGGSPKVGGYKIAAGYEWHLLNPHWVMGGSLSYLAVTEDAGNFSTRFRSMPLLFVPKYTFGDGKIKGYVKASGGYQSSKFTYHGPLEAIDHDFGIAFGGGAGANYTLNEKLFLNIDYEFLRINNSAAEEVSISSISLGLGIMIP